MPNSARSTADSTEGRTITTTTTLTEATISSTEGRAGGDTRTAAARTSGNDGRMDGWVSFTRAHDDGVFIQIYCIFQEILNCISSSLSLCIAKNVVEFVWYLRSCQPLCGYFCSMLFPIFARLALNTSTMWFWASPASGISHLRGGRLRVGLEDESNWYFDHAELFLILFCKTLSEIQSA